MSANHLKGRELVLPSSMYNNLGKWKLDKPLSENLSSETAKEFPKKMRKDEDFRMLLQSFRKHLECLKICSWTRETVKPKL